MLRTGSAKQIEREAVKSELDTKERTILKNVNLLSMIFIYIQRMIWLRIQSTLNNSTHEQYNILAIIQYT